MTRQPHKVDHRHTWDRRPPLAGEARDRARREADRLYRTGLSMAAVGSAIGRAQDTVRTLLREAGTPIRLRTGRTLDHRPMAHLNMRIPAGFHDLLVEYAELRAIPYNDAVIDVLGRGLGEKWAGRRQPSRRMK